MFNLAVVALGGAFGSIARYYLSNSTLKHFIFFDIPFAILFVNILGSFVFGVFMGLIENNILISTAITYAVIHSKPIIQLYSSKYSIPRESIDLYPYLNKLLGSSSVDICNFKVSDIKKKLKINKKKYRNFKYQFLTPVNKSCINTENYKLIGKVLNQNQTRDSF